MRVIIQSMVFCTSLGLLSALPLCASAQASGLDEKNKELLKRESELLKKIETGKEAKAPVAEVKVKEEVVAKTESVAKTETVAKVDSENISEKSLVAEQAPVAKVSISESKPPAASRDTTGKQLQQAQARIEKLTNDLAETRNRLMIAETEVERLSARLHERDRAKLDGTLRTSTARTNVVAPRPNTATSRTSAERLRDVTRQSEGKAAQDMEVVIVTVDKAQLRTGPGVNNSPLMALTKGTTLAVETRKGDWYRVMSPTGTRAWISSDLVKFSSKESEVDSTVGVRGYDSSVDDRAFELLKKKPQ